MFEIVYIVVYACLNCYLKIQAIKNVKAGTMLPKAVTNVAVVYFMPA